MQTSGPFQRPQQLESICRFDVLLGGIQVMGIHHVIQQQQDITHPQITPRIHVVTPERINRTADKLPVFKLPLARMLIKRVQ
jgi:hypothetical protein